MAKLNGQPVYRGERLVGTRPVHHISTGRLARRICHPDAIMALSGVESLPSPVDTRLMTGGGAVVVANNVLIKDKGIRVTTRLRTDPEGEYETFSLAVSDERGDIVVLARNKLSKIDGRVVGEPFTPDGAVLWREFQGWFELFAPGSSIAGHKEPPLVRAQFEPDRNFERIARKYLALVNM